MKNCCLMVIVTTLNVTLSGISRKLMMSLEERDRKQMEASPGLLERHHAKVV